MSRLVDQRCTVLSHWRDAKVMIAIKAVCSSCEVSSSCVYEIASCEARHLDERLNNQSLSMNALELITLIRPKHYPRCNVT